MSTIQRFEDLEIWQMSRDICKEIYRLANSSPFNRDFKLKNQILGSSGSVMDNIAEGFERDGNSEFVQFLSIAKGSAGETRSQLYRALDQEYINKKEFDETCEKLIHLSNKIGKFMSYLSNSGMKGIKFKNKIRNNKPRTTNNEQ